MRISDWSSDVCSSDLGTMIGWLFSDMFDRFPKLKIVLSEGNIGWMPYFIERAEQVIDKQRHWAKRMNVQMYQGRSGRSEERRVGKEGVWTCRSRWTPEHKKKQTCSNPENNEET